MRLLVIAEVFPPRPGGSGRWLWELYRRMPPDVVSVLAGEAERASAFDKEQLFAIARTPLRFRSWGLRSSREYLSAIRAARSAARTHGATRVHAGKALPEGLVAWALRRLGGAPYWVYVHGEELTLVRGSRELAWLTRLVLRSAERLVANTSHTRGMLTSAWSIEPDRVVVLHPGVDVDRFVPKPRDAAARAALGWGARPVVLTVGALQERKGQDTMIRALPALRERFPDVLYVMAGEGWQRSRLEQIAADLGVGKHVQFRGVADEGEIVTCYQQCDVFVLANRQVGWDFEGYGMVLLEAQACARPVITGASGGTAEAVDAPRTGLIVPCESPGPLAEAVASLLADPDRAARMGRDGRQWVVEARSWAGLSTRARVVFEAAATAPTA